MAKSHVSEQMTTSSKDNIGVSNRVVCLLNSLSLLCSLPLLGAGIWLAARHGTDCARFFMWPIIALGLFIFLFSLVGLIGAYLRIKILLWLYLAITVLVIIALLCVTIFAFVVTNRGSGESVVGRQFQEYQLNKYSKWLQQQVSKQANWETIKTCIQDAGVCQTLNYTDSASFSNANLSPLQSGCCKPPTACNFEFVNATDWIQTTASSVQESADCSTWSNKQSELCYDCDSCRAGVAENFRRDWGKIAVLCAVLLVFLIVVYTLGCCAVRSSKNHYYEKRVEINSASGKRRMVQKSRF